MDLGDLNIVSIVAGPKAVQPVKRKKNSKYDKRRQRAQRAKEQQQVPKQAQTDPTNDETTIGLRDATPVKTVDPGEEEFAGSVPESETPPASSDEAEVKETVSLSASAKNPMKEAIFSHESTTAGIDTGGKASEQDQSDERSVPASRRRLETPLATDAPTAADLEHAKYMAEFHARPMELDRRSGARSATLVSKKSSHLFVQANDWDSLKLHSRLVQTLTSTKFGLVQPTGIQSRTIQTIQDPKNAQKNVLVHSETGSGKTLAYLLPILQSLAFGTDGSLKRQLRKTLGTKCIILCPTRELASQTLTVVEKICQANFAGWMVPGGLLGGDSRSSEKSRIRKGLAIVIATPGRLLDHLNKTESILLNLKGKLQWLVLDEADRLLDMGLGDQVRQIVQSIRANEASKSQPWWRCVLVSATVTPSVQALAKERMLCGDQEWVWVKGGSEVEKTRTSSNESGEEVAQSSSRSEKEEGYSNSTPRQLAQFHITVTAKLRMSTLISFLVQRVSKGERTVVFMGTCASVDYHHMLFQSMESLWDVGEDENTASAGLFGTKGKVFKLHGSVQHSKRNQTLKLFDKAVDGGILLTTDVSARGLNLEGVDWIVQYDPPCELADYVHRVGRVARAGKAGHSLLFLLPSERGYLDVLETKGIANIQALSLAATLNEAASQCPDWTNAGLKFGGNREIRQGKGGDIRRGSRQGEHFAAEIQRRLEDCIVQDDISARKKWKEQQKANKKRRKDTPSKSKEGELLELARDAFMSFLRAYSTKKEPSVRSIFSARALHLGHVARSFALKEPPKSLVSKHKQNQKANTKQEAADQQANRSKSLQFSEYDNNLVSLSEDETDKDNQGSRPFKRSKKTEQQDSGRTKNARTMLLTNAMKMQNNLMDAM